MDLDHSFSVLPVSHGGLTSDFISSFSLNRYLLLSSHRLLKNRLGAV
jgi:hypothetical protein